MTEIDLELDGYNLTVVPDDQLCPLCLNQVVTERARIEMCLEPKQVHLCTGCKAKEHIVQRERMSFPEAAEGWLTMVSDILGMRDGSGRAPVRILLPNGTAVNAKADLKVRRNPYPDRRLYGQKQDEYIVEIRINPIAFRDEAEHSILKPGSFHDLQVYEG
jgi:hypothetical protein